MTSRKIVLVQGAWGSSASWTPVADLLRGMGHQVFVPSFTGLGERTHLFSGAINLDTHIGDVCGLIEAEGLEEFDLVGHSYGGMVITGVADRYADRIRTLTYLDAFLPEDGQSALDLLGPDVAMANLAMAGEYGGFAVPPPARHATRVPEHLRHYMTSRSPQPFATMIQKIKLSGPIGKSRKGCTSRPISTNRRSFPASTPGSAPIRPGSPWKCRAATCCSSKCRKRSPASSTISSADHSLAEPVKLKAAAETPPPQPAYYFTIGLIDSRISTSSFWCFSSSPLVPQ